MKIQGGRKEAPLRTHLFRNVHLRYEPQDSESTTPVLEVLLKREAPNTADEDGESRSDSWNSAQEDRGSHYWLRKSLRRPYLRGPKHDKNVPFCYRLCHYPHHHQNSHVES